MAVSALKSLLPENVRSALRGVRRKARAAGKRAAARIKRPNLYRLDTPERVGVIFTAPSDMRIDERLFLYSFVRGFQPERVLEIGTFQGGGGAIMANALEEIGGRGRIVAIDPEPDLRVKEKDFHGRYTVIRKFSPDAIPEAREQVGGPFDFALVDGLHTYDQVKRDIAGLLPHLADGAYVLFHDAFHYGVATAIREAVEGEPRLLHDCGYVCRTARVGSHPYTPYNGFRLLRCASGPLAGPRPPLPEPSPGSAPWTP
jgi:predicted O-methyltransferase YrrM